MPKNTKIATCSYCGTRAALVLTGKHRHELSCTSCGAQLHDMKMLRADAVDGRSHPVGRRRTQGDVHATPLPAWEREALAGARRSKPKKKKRKSFAKKFFEEAFDVIEDILD